jgi:hypothetical protein
MKTIFPTLILLCISGCVVQPTPESSSVRIITDKTKYDCEFINTVTGSGSMGWTPAHDSEGALNEIRNDAARLGANAVSIINADSDALSSVIMAEALNCNFAKPKT